MAGMRLLVAPAMMLAVVAIAACVEVPDNVRAHFADTREGERSNFRKGPKGNAPPSPAPAPAPQDAAAPDAGATDGGAS
jgi:hypothetical protein